jgi:hypothetical protein
MLLAGCNCLIRGAFEILQLVLCVVYNFETRILNMFFFGSQKEESVDNVVNKNQVLHIKNKAKILAEAFAQRKETEELQRSILENPEITLQRDFQNNLILHTQLAKKDTDINLLRTLITVKPETLKLSGRFARLPLHCALVRVRTPIEVVRMVLEGNPAAVKHRTNGGWLPLHYAADHDKPSIPAMQLLLEAEPESIAAMDMELKMALHWAVDHDVISVSSVLWLFYQHPEAAIHNACVEWRNPAAPGGIEGYHIWSPLDKLLQKYVMGGPCAGVHLCAARIMMRHLGDKLSAGLRERRAVLNWNARRNILMCVAFSDPLINDCICYSHNDDRSPTGVMENHINDRFSGNLEIVEGLMASKSHEDISFGFLPWIVHRLVHGMDDHVWRHVVSFL